MVRFMEPFQELEDSAQKDMEVLGLVVVLVVVVMAATTTTDSFRMWGLSLTLMGI